MSNQPMLTCTQNPPQFPLRRALDSAVRVKIILIHARASAERWTQRDNLNLHLFSSRAARVRGHNQFLGARQPRVRRQGERRRIQHGDGNALEGRGRRHQDEDSED